MQSGLRDIREYVNKILAANQYGKVINIKWYNNNNSCVQDPSPLAYYTVVTGKLSPPLQETRSQSPPPPLSLFSNSHPQPLAWKHTLKNNRVWKKQVHYNKYMTNW
jgi:hypothetical protein